MKLRTSREHLRQIGADAKARAPIEACGVLVGVRRKGGFEVLEVLPAPNELSSPTRFEINPERLYEFIKGAEGKGLEVIGFYHSHLGYGAGPSATDLEHLKFLPNLVWLICDVSTAGAEFRAFVMRSGALVELEVVVA
ncbi:MAG: M67 family metallopeptidase [Candidatus Hodarchaeaceae archaeon]|nr:M67 family metallopeptidase [Candidatus Hodarchaeaceae archaeon]